MAPRTSFRDKYDGPPFSTEEREELCDARVRRVVPILRVRQDFIDSTEVNLLSLVQTGSGQLTATISFATTELKYMRLSTAIASVLSGSGRKRKDWPITAACRKSQSWRDSLFTWRSFVYFYHEQNRSPQCLRHEDRNIHLRDAS